jgi:hypothetical protein
MCGRSGGRCDGESEASAVMSDWITPAASIATVVVATVGVWIAWRVYQFAVHQKQPVIGVKLTWRVDPVLGRHIEVCLRIVNGFDSTLSFASAAMDRPRGAKISGPGLPGVGVQPYAGTPPRPAAPTTAKIDLGWKVQAKGSIGTAVDGRERTDVSHQTLYVFPPSSWDGGAVSIVLIASSNADEISDKRFAIKRSIPAMSISTKLVNASKTA